MQKKNKRHIQDEWIVEDIPEETVIIESDCLIKEPTTETNEEENSADTNSKTKKKLKKDILLQRSEASLNVSEFNLTEVGKEKIKLNELLKSSLKTTGQNTQKSLQSLKKLKKLSTPLSKQKQEKIKRTVAYEKLCDDVSKWESLVQKNRTADQLVFPLKKPDFQLQSLENTLKNFVSKHPVEVAVSQLLEKSENKLEPDKPLTAAEEKALQAMSPAEAKQRHAELMRHRALISYREAKARHQNKIKSKRYHRLLKKEKLRKAMKEFEQLQKNDAEKALEKLAELDKLRILERMTLKHRNTGKWAKQHKLRAKYNPESRSILKEDLAVGRQLREKVDVPVNTNKPLYSFEKNDVEVEDFGLIEEVHGNNEDDISQQNNYENNDEEENRDEVLEEDSYQFNSNANKEQTNKNVIPKKKSDAMDFFLNNHDLESATPDNLTFGEEDIDEIMNDAMPLSEAYGDEDVIAEFREEKKMADKANQPEGINLFLPGWGSWGGPGIKQSKRKMRKFFIKPPSVPKKDTLGNVILNEDKKAATHQVSSLPHPFTNVGQFESYIRQPVGHTWNPQSTFQNLVAPKVITKMGKIIDPIDADDLVLNKPKTQVHKKNKKKKRMHRWRISCSS